jgi:rhamnosyltransferase
VEKHSVCGAVILYNPDSSVKANIASYISSVDLLFAIDNSDNSDPTILADLQKEKQLVYISMGGNCGIGSALNAAAALATSRGYQWLLTMDQDTCVIRNVVEEIPACLHAYEKDEISIIASRYTYKNPYVEKQGERFSELFAAITSGSLMNLAVYKIVGPFLDQLFIDQVDHEYCLRSKRRGFKILQANNARIQHRLGNARKELIGSCSHYSAARRYYISRNRLFVIHLYRKDFPEFCRHEIFSFIQEIIKILFYEQDKLNKFKNIILGYLDYSNNNFDRKLL